MVTEFIKNDEKIKYINTDPRCPGAVIYLPSYWLQEPNEKNNWGFLYLDGTSASTDKDNFDPKFHLVVNSLERISTGHRFTGFITKTYFYGFYKEID